MSRQLEVRLSALEEAMGASESMYAEGRARLFAMLEQYQARAPEGVNPAGASQMQLIACRQYVDVFERYSLEDEEENEWLIPLCMDWEARCRGATFEVVRDEWVAEADRLVAEREETE